MRSFRPREETLAARVLAVLTAGAAGVTLLFTVVFPTQQTQQGTTLTVCGCLMALALAGHMATTARMPSWLWASYPFAAVGLIALLDLASSDASVTAQIFFLFPALYAGAQLPRRPALAIAAAAVVAELLVTSALLDASTAVLDTCFVATFVFTATGLLVVAGERNDRLIAQLERQAAIDHLTGLSTRRVLDSAASSALQAASTDVGTALLLIDVDRFKRVNDKFGHPAGDLILQEIAQIVRDVTQPTDVVSRLGGDEMAVLMPACSMDSALSRAERLAGAVRSRAFDLASAVAVAPGGVSPKIRISLSVGVAHFPTHATDLQQLYAAADASLYQAKTHGRDQVGPVAQLGLR